LNNNCEIIHRDLKGANIFLFQNGERIEIKIGDFADSLSNVNKFNKSYFGAGSLRWMVNS
jgi:serine/threonine protein kinase